MKYLIICVVILAFTSCSSGGGAPFLGPDSVANGTINFTIGDGSGLLANTGSSQMALTSSTYTLSDPTTNASGSYTVQGGAATFLHCTDATFLQFVVTLNWTSTTVGTYIIHGGGGPDKAGHQTGTFAYVAPLVAPIIAAPILEAPQSAN